MWTIIFLFSLILFTYLWYINTHIKEQAFELAYAAVEKNGYQLLDDAIGLSQYRVLRHGARLSLMRTFEFHYADENGHRHIGHVIRCGKEWLNVKLMSNYSSENDDPKIIPFPGIYTND